MPDTPDTPADDTTATAEDVPVDPEVAAEALTRRQRLQRDVQGTTAEADEQRTSQRQMQAMMEEMVDDATRKAAREATTQMRQMTRSKTPSELAAEGNIGGYAQQLQLRSPQGKTFNWQQYLAQAPKYPTE